MKKDLNKIFGFNMVYQLIFVGGSIVSAIFLAFCTLGSAREMTDKKLIELLMTKSGEISLISLLIAFIFVVSIRRKKLFTEDLKSFNHPSRPIKINVLLISILLLFSVQLCHMIVTPLVESLANQFNYTMIPYLENLEMGENNLAMFIYACFLAPIVEEIVFRGIILKRMLPYGKYFAIFFSSLLFGFFHGELTQGCFAFFCGLILAYLTLMYSIKWGIFVHIFNNLVISTLLGKLINLLPENLIEPTNIIVTAVFGLFGLYMLWLNRKEIIINMQENMSLKNRYKKTITSIGFMITLLWSLYNFIDVFSKR